MAGPVPVIWPPTAGSARKPSVANRKTFGSKQLQPGPTDACQSAFALQCAKDVSRHLSARPHETGQLRPGQHGWLVEEQRAMLRQNPDDP